MQGFRVAQTWGFFDANSTTASKNQLWWRERGLDYLTGSPPAPSSLSACDYSSIDQRSGCQSRCHPTPLL